MAPASKKAPASFDVSLGDLIRAGLVKPDATLEKRYKGKLFTAQVDAEGRVKFAGTTYDSLSKAGGAARATIVGHQANGQVPPTNGWTFWAIAGDGSKQVQLAALRDQYVADSDGSENTR